MSVRLADSVAASARSLSFLLFLLIKILVWLIPAYAFAEFTSVPYWTVSKITRNPSVTPGELESLLNVTGGYCALRLRSERRLLGRVLRSGCGLGVDDNHSVSGACGQEIVNRIALSSTASMLRSSDFFHQIEVHQRRVQPARERLVTCSTFLLFRDFRLRRCHVLSSSSCPLGVSRRRVHSFGPFPK